MSELLISACTIVKNEAEYLPGMFECFNDLVDEFVVVDNGSTDGTLDLRHPKLRMLQSECFTADTDPLDFHFGNARNEAMYRAQGVWLLNIDPEYRMTHENVLRLRRHIVNGGADNYDIIAVVLASDTERVYQPFFVRRSTGRRYEGCVHETIYARDLRVTALDGVEIRHLRPVTLQTKEEHDAKRHRYLMMAVNVLLKNPNDEHALGIVAQQFRNCGMYREAKAACLYTLKYNKNRTYDADFVSNTMLLLAECYLAQGLPDVAIEQLKGVLLYRPSAAEAEWAIGEIYRMWGNLDEAEKWFHKAMQNKAPKIFMIDKPVFRAEKPQEGLRLIEEERNKQKQTA